MQVNNKSGSNTDPCGTPGRLSPYHYFPTTIIQVVLKHFMSLSPFSENLDFFSEFPEASNGQTPWRCQKT